jgi:hypothetical protein
LSLPVEIGEIIEIGLVLDGFGWIVVLQAFEEPVEDTGIFKVGDQFDAHC